VSEFLDARTCVRTMEECVLESLPREASTAAEVRRIVQRSAAAGAEKLAELRHLALTAGDALVVANVVRALGRLSDVAADPELDVLLDDRRPRVRQEFVRALGKPGADSAVPRLGRVLAGCDPKLRCLAIQALGRVGGERALRLVQSVLDDRSASATDHAFATQALVEEQRARLVPRRCPVATEDAR
jgi:HEAT repeat protein